MADGVPSTQHHGERIARPTAAPPSTSSFYEVGGGVSDAIPDTAVTISGEPGCGPPSPVMPGPDAAGCRQAREPSWETHRLRYSDPDEWRTESLEPEIQGSAILGVDVPRLDDEAALVPVSLWCGGTCGTWLTYRLERTESGWQVTGIEGPVSVS